MQTGLSCLTLSSFYIKQVTSVQSITEYALNAFQLKKNGQFNEAIELLLKIINVTEEESRFEKLEVAPAYYEELANIYKKLKMLEEEKQILIKFSRQIHSPGVKSVKLFKRLENID